MISTIDDQETRDIARDAKRRATIACAQATIATICALAALTACGLLYASVNHPQMQSMSVPRQGQFQK